MVSAVTSSDSTTAAQSTSTNTKSTSITEFSALFSKLINPDKSGSVNEEELFAGIAHERIKALKGDSVAAQYENALTKAKGQMQKPDGFVSYEDASMAALKSLKKSGALSAAEADQIYSEAFAAAQIDNNTAALWDSRGGKGDTTIAVASMESALANAKLLVDKIVAGEKTVDAKSLESGGASTPAISSAASSSSSTTSSGVITATGTVIDGADGFLFKPVSANDGKLAVLLPELLAHRVSHLVLKDPTGNILEEGRSTGYGEIGTREKFSFSKAGAKYPDNLHVVATLEDGSQQIWQIPDPAKRYD